VTEQLRSRKCENGRLEVEQHGLNTSTGNVTVRLPARKTEIASSRRDHEAIERTRREADLRLPGRQPDGDVPVEVFNSMLFDFEPTFSPFPRS